MFITIFDASKLFTKLDVDDDSKLKSAFGKLPFVITGPPMVVVPVLPGVTNMAPVPMFDSPVAEDKLAPPDPKAPMVETARPFAPPSPEPEEYPPENPEPNPEPDAPNALENWLLP